jgi:hypothetical protein
MRIRLLRWACLTALLGVALVVGLLPTQAQDAGGHNAEINKRITDWQTPGNKSFDGKELKHFAWGVPDLSVTPKKGPSTGDPAVSLHIGINEYEPVNFTGENLAACVNDARAMRALAIAEGFDAEELLTDRQATAVTIKNRIRGLKEKVPTGGTVLLTFAGHGLNLDNEDDLRDPEIFGTDSTWCAHDRFIVDDELYNIFSEFHQSVNIIVVSDSCFSGSVTRAGAAVNRANFAAQTARLARTPSVLGRSVLAAARQARTAAANAELPKGTVSHTRTLSPKAREAAIRAQRQNLINAKKTTPSERQTRGKETGPTVLLLAACRDDQLSIEFPDGSNGIFTAALIRAWANGNFNGNYQELKSRIAQLLSGEVQETQLFPYGPRRVELEMATAFSH